MKTIRIAIYCLTGLLALSQWGCSLGLRQDYILDRNAVYSPDDPFVRGAVYRAHTGHDGHYYNCDEEECKRYLPWIHWNQRPCDTQSCWREVCELRQSFDDAACRWKMGSCQVCREVGFPPGAGYGNESDVTTVEESAEAPAPMSIELSNTKTTQDLDEIQEQQNLRYVSPIQLTALKEKLSGRPVQR